MAILSCPHIRILTALRAEVSNCVYSYTFWSRNWRCHLCLHVARQLGHTQVEKVPDELMISRYQWDINLSLLSSRRNVNTWLLSNLFSLLLHIREGKPRLGINRQMDHLFKPGKIAGETWTKFNECIDFKCQLSFVWFKSLPGAVYFLFVSRNIMLTFYLIKTRLFFLIWHI